MILFVSKKEFDVLTTALWLRCQLMEDNPHLFDSSEIQSHQRLLRKLSEERGGRKRKYRGKYPNRVHSVSVAGGYAHVVTNAGREFKIHASQTAGNIPQCGRDIAEYL